MHLPEFKCSVPSIETRNDAGRVFQEFVSQVPKRRLDDYVANLTRHNVCRSHRAVIGLTIMQHTHTELGGITHDLENALMAWYGFCNIKDY